MDAQCAEFVSGGYYLARVLEKPSCRGSADGIVASGSSCICEFFPNPWAIEWTTDSAEERAKHANLLGTGLSQLPAVIAWATAAFSEEFGWPNVFYSLAAAQAARSRFFGEDAGMVAFGLGLHQTDVKAFLQAAKPPPQEPGYSPVGETGVSQCVSTGEAIASGGEVLGFELLSVYVGIFTCSWLCHGWDKVCAEELRVAPNSHGFIDSYSDASHCAQFISRDVVGAEPGLWLPWLLTVYPGVAG